MKTMAHDLLLQMAYSSDVMRRHFLLKKVLEPSAILDLPFWINQMYVQFTDV